MIDKIKAWVRRGAAAQLGLILVYGVVSAIRVKTVGGGAFMFGAYLLARFMVGKFPWKAA